MKTITLPNNENSFVIQELHDRLLHGLTVRIAFGGDSMLPLINAKTDQVSFCAVAPDEPLRTGDVYLFLYQGRCVIHRLLRQRRGMLLFRGDNCRLTESVPRSAVWARLVAVHHADGAVDHCQSPSWRRRSRWVSACRSLRNLPHRLFAPRRRLRQRWCYFALLLLLMWAPVGGLGVPLDNFVFGIRFDHLLHASVYIPCVLYLFDFPLFRRRLLPAWLAALLLALLTESVQYLLPYRGFDINDMVANFLGVSLGALLLRLAMRK